MRVFDEDQTRTARAPFVGRREALAELGGHVADALNGRGGLVVIEGDAGIGKTTVAGLVADRAAEQGAWCGWVACPSGGGGPALWPWSQLLSACLADVPTGQRRRVIGDDNDTVRALTAQAAGAGSGAATAGRTGTAGGAETGGRTGTAGGAETGGGAGSADDAGAARFGLFQALSRIWVRASRWSPLVLVLDDLAWADTASVLLAAHLGRTLANHRVLVLATVRTGEAAAALNDLRQVSRTVLLAGLGPDDISALIDHSGVATAPGLVDVIADRTGGNPFYVTELLRALASNRGQAGTATRVAATEVPRHVTEALHSRLARLPTQTAALLEAASVLGAEGSVEGLAGLAGLGVAEALTMLDVAVTGGLVSSPAPDRWRFTHALVRDAVYEGLGLAARRRLHQRAAETVGALQPAAAAERARHSLAALPLGDRDDAVDLAAAAGRQAMTQLAYEEAAGWFAAALAALAEQPSPAATRVAELQLALGFAHRSAGDFESAQTAFRGAADRAGRDGEMLAAAALGHADPGADLGLAYRADDPFTSDLLERALDAIGPEDSTSRVMLLARLGAELYFSSDPTRSGALAAEAVDVARRLDDPRARVIAMALRHDSHVVGQADPATALRGSTEMLEIARTTGDIRLLLTAHRARVFDLLALGDLVGADAEIAAFRRLADTSGVPSYQWWIGVWRAMRALADGELDRAESLAVEAFEVGNRTFARLGMLAFGNLSFLLFFVRREQGRLSEMEDTIRLYAAEWADIPAMAVALPSVLAELGRQEEAAAALASVAGDRFARLRDRNWPVTWFLLARVAYLVGDRQRAEQLAELGGPLAGQCLMVSVGTAYLGAADLGLAWVNDTLDRLDEADEWYRRAEATNARLGLRTWLAQARIDHARMLVRRGDDRGRELATQARATAAALGLGPVLTASEALLARATAPTTDPTPVAATAGPGPVAAPASATGPAAARSPEGNVFRREGPSWHLSYAGVSVRVPDAKGLGDIGWLLAHPGRPIHVGELVGRQAPGVAAGAAAGADVLDTTAREEMRARMAELQSDIDEADADHDDERAARARLELDQLIDHLSRAVGLGGRTRRLGDDTERARKTVGVRVRNSLVRLGRVHPGLAGHLERSVDTGVWCVYRPEQETAWDL